MLLYTSQEHEGNSLWQRSFLPEPVPSNSSPSSNLPLGKRRHPSHNHIKSNNHASHDPEALRIVRAMESEKNSKDDSAKVPHSTNRSAQNAIGVRMHMRNQRKIGSIASFKEESHACYQTEHRRLVVWVEQSDSDEEGAGDDADEEDPGFLEPEVGGDVLVEEVADDAS